MNRDNEQMMQPASAGSVRFIFEYEGDQIRLVSQQEINVEPPPGSPELAPAEQTGFWLEVRDTGLHVLHRQQMHDPVMTHPEVFSNEPGKTIARSETPRQKGAFTVVVPRFASSDHLAFMRVDAETRAKAAEAVAGGPVGEIARFPLRPQPKTDQKEKEEGT